MIRELNTALTVDRLTTGGVLHVSFAGRSFDVSMPGLEIEPVSTDEAVKLAIADYLEVPTYRLDDYVIDRHGNGNLTLRVESVLW